MTKYAISLGIIFTFLFGIPFVSSADQLADMKDDLSMRINLVKRYHQKYSKNLVVAAQDEVFKKYFAAKSKDEKAKVKKEIDQVSLSVQAKYKVDEMCFIDKSGQEISRIVFNKIAPDEDLSPDEASADFFAPSFALPPKKVHVTNPYMSPDSLRWVIAYVTPTALDDGSKPAIYHYELSLYDFQKSINKGLENDKDNYLLLVNKEGFIMSDSRKKFKLELDKSDKEMKAPLKDYFPVLKDSDAGSLAGKILSGSEGTGNFSKGGAEYMVSYRPLKYGDWTAVLVNKKK